MARTVIINGVVVTAQTEILEHHRIDGELTTYEIVIKDSTQLEAYDMGLEVTIIEDTAESFYTGADSVVLASRSPKKYTHSITLIEPIKIFERITIPSLQYTQALDTTTYTLLDVLDRALKISQQDEVSDLGGNRVYEISGVPFRSTSDEYNAGSLSGFALALYNKKAPEMKFNTPTFKELCDEIGEIMNGKIIIEDFDTINIAYYEEKSATEIDLNDIDDISALQSIDKNAQTYDIYMENAISEANVNKQARVFPSKNAWGSVRSTETELTTSNFIMQVNEDIERVLKFELYADVKITYTDDLIAAQTFDGELYADMTEYLFTKRAWNALDYDFTSWIYAKYKNNTLYFEGNQIKGWHEALDIWSPFANIKQWHLILGQMLVESNPVGGVTSISLGALNKPKFNTDVREFMFRLTYVPKETVRVKIGKDKNVGFGTLYYNQTARIVDSEALGINAQSKINKEGAKSITLTKTVDNLSDAFQLTDYYGNYSAYAVDNKRMTNYVLSVVQLSEYFTKRSERIDISNKPRQTEISAENTFRLDNINHYVEVGYDVQQIADNTSYLLNNGITRFLDTFKDTPVYSDAVEIAVWNDELILECTSQGLANVISFNFTFEDNIQAGVQTAALDTIYGNKFITYAGASGILDTCNIDFYGSFEAATPSFANDSAIAQELPEFTPANITFGTQYIEVPEIQILKDSGEVYGITYQMQIVSVEDEVFVGNKLATENALVVVTNDQLYLYYSTSDIPFEQTLDTSLTKQTIVTGTPVDSSEVKLSTSISLGSGRLTWQTNFDTTKNWAIADINGNVYLICNKINESSIYINPKKNRSD